MNEGLQIEEKEKLLQSQVDRQIIHVLIKMLIASYCSAKELNAVSSRLRQ